MLSESNRIKIKESKGIKIEDGIFKTLNEETLIIMRKENLKMGNLNITYKMNKSGNKNSRQIGS